MLRRCCSVPAPLTQRLARHTRGITSTTLLALAEYALHRLNHGSKTLEVFPLASLVETKSIIEYRYAPPNEGGDLTLHNGQPVPLSSNPEKWSSGNGGAFLPWDGPLFNYSLSPFTGKSVIFPDANPEHAAPIGLPLFFPERETITDLGEVKAVAPDLVFVPIPYALFHDLENEVDQLGTASLSLVILADYGLMCLLNGGRLWDGETPASHPVRFDARPRNDLLMIPMGKSAD